MAKKGKGFPELPFQHGSSGKWFNDSRTPGEPSFGGKSKPKPKVKKGK